MTRSIAMISGTGWYLWNFRRNVIRAFTDQGWTVHAVAGPDDWSGDLGAMENVELHDWPVSMDGMHPVEEFRALRQVAGLLRRTGADMVFNNGIKANVYGGLAARRLKRPYVNNISGLGMRMRAGDMKAKGLARLYAFGSAKAEALLVQNPGDLAFLQAHGLPTHVRTISTMGSGVDLDHFQAEPLPSSAPRRIVFVGRLQADKGIADLMAAIREVPDVELTVVGDTTHANAGVIPSETLQAWKAEARVSFVGHQADVRPHLAAAHALVMPSHGGEGMPKVILEAAALGRPAIVSDIDGCRDSIVPGETGWLAPSQDPEGLAAVIRDFATRPDAELARMSAAARRRAEAHFSDRAIARVCLDLAEQALGLT